MENTAPPPVTPTLTTESRTTPKDFFLWLGAIVALYASLTSLITLLFEYINYTYPDPLAGYPDPYGGAMRAAMATAIVLVPTSILLLRVIRSITDADPSKMHIWVRRWALVLTVFIASAVVVVDLITLVTTFLGGEITIRFALKAAVILLAGLGISLHFLADMKGYWATEPKKAATVGIVFAIMAAAIVVSGFLVIGTPQHARLIRYDQQKVQDLQSIQYELTNYYQLKRTVPNKLSELSDPLSGFAVPTDVQRGAEYEYTPVTSTSFTLCATFNETSSETAGKGAYPQSVSPYGGIDQSFSHTAGQQCFTRTIDPARYPATPKAL
ncbi:MAG: DUF5671 domain-containing protein [Candidatus Paceibacterota bacterium]